MNKVLIVDDEYLVRELIKRSLNWEELGCEIVSEASGGMEAIDQVEELHPDIIITDICMPIMDGIKLSTKILEKYPQIKIVVLTGHDEFVYAKESVSIGIKEYLLKPINPDELKKAVIKLCDGLKAERHRDESYSKIIPYLREKTFNDLVSLEGPAEDIEDDLERYGIIFNSNSFQVALLKVISPSPELFNNRYRVFNTINDHFISNNSVYSFLGDSGLIVLLSHDSSFNLDLFCNRIINNIVGRLSISVSIGIGRKVSGIYDINNSYYEAYKALEYIVVEGLNTVISFNDIGIVSGYSSVNYEKLIKELNFSLKAGLVERFRENVDELFSLQIRGVGGDIESIRIMSSNILSEILTVMSELGLELRDVFDQEGQPYERIFKEKTLEGIVKHFVNLGDKIIHIIKERSGATSSKLISDVKLYLKDHLSDPEIQLSSVAERFHVNSSYLSRKFKQECGENFMEHLAFLRIEKAVELLKITDKRSYEIADEVGISDPHYFSIFFKKKMKMSISEYKKQLKVK